MLQGLLCLVQSRKMNGGFPSSLLVVTGLLRLAGVLGASETEPWSSPSADRSFLGDSLVTAKSHLISRSEDDTEKVTLQFDSLTSDLANQDVSHFHEVSGTEVEATSEDGGQTLPVLTRKPASPKQSLHRAVLDPQSKVPITSQSLFTTGLPESKATSFRHLLEKLETLPREEGKAEATSQEPRMTLTQSASTPSKVVAMDVNAIVLPDSEPSGSAEQRADLSVNPSAATATTFAFPENRTGTEGYSEETTQTLAKKGMKKLLTLIPKASPWTQAVRQQTQLDMRTSVAGRTPGLLEQTQSPSFKESSTVLFHQPFSEEKMTILPRTKLMESSPSASSPYREEDETIEFRMAGNPVHLTASQSNTLSSSFLLTPNTLSSESPPHSASPRNAGQSVLPKLLFVPQFSLSNKSGLSDESEEQLQDKTDHQTAPQTSHVRLSQSVGEPRRTQATPSLQETTLESWPKTSLLLHSTAQPQDIPFLVDDKPHVSVLGMPQPAHPMSAQARSTMSSMSISSTVPSPSDAVSTPVGYIMQGTSKSQLPDTFLTVHGEQPFSNVLVLSFSESESLETTTLTKPEIHGTHDGQKRRASLVSPSSAERESEPSTVALASSFLHAGFSTSAVADSSHSGSKQSVLPTLVPSESQRKVSGTSVPFHAQQQLLHNFASAPTRATASGSLVPFHVEPNVSGTSSSGLNVPDTTFLGHSSQKLSPETSVSFYTKAPSLPAQSLQPQSIYTTYASGELQIDVSGTNVPSHVNLQMLGGSASLIDESHLLVTSAHVEPVTDEASLGQGLSISVDAKPQITESSASSPTKPQLLEVSAHEFLDALAKLRGLSQNESHTPKMPSSTPVQNLSPAMTFHGNLKSRLSNASAFVHAESLLTEAPASAGAETQMPSRLTPVHSGLQLQDAPGLPTTTHTAGKVREGKQSPQTSFPTSQSDSQGTTVQDVSVSAFSRRSPLSSDGPTSPISHQTKINIPFTLDHKVEENITSLRTTPMLAMAGAQGLMQSSLGLIQYLSRPDIGSLDSFASSGILGMSPSLQYLSHLVQNAENMVCLQPMRNTTPSLGEPIGSGQEMLILSSALGFSHPGVSSLIQMSPSSVILVKPVFVFLPPEAPKDHVPLPNEEEVGHDASRSFTSKTALVLVTPGIQEPLVSTLRHSLRANTNSPNLLDHLVTSGPASSAPPTHAEASLVRSITSTANPLLYRLRDHSTRAKHGLTTDHNEDFQLSALDSQRLEEDNPVSLSAGMLVKHHISAAPPVMVPIQQQSKTVSPTTELLSTLDKVSSQPSLTEPSASRMATSSPQAANNLPLLNSTAMLHTEERPYGSVTSVTRISENSEESLSASSVRNTKLPLEVGQHFAPSSSALRGSLISERSGKTPSKAQYVPNAVSTFPASSTAKEHKEAAALNNPHAEAFNVANETASYHMNTTFHKPSDSHRFQSQAPRTDESLKTPSLSTLFSADALMQMTRPGKHPEDIMNHSRPSADVPSQVSTHSYSAKLVTENNPATVMPRGRLFLASTAEQLKPMLSAIETKTLTDIGTYNQTKATSLMSTVPATDSGHLSASLVASDFRLTSSSPASSSSSSSSYAAGSADHQKEVHKLLLHPVHSFAPNSMLKDTTLSLVAEEALLLKTPQTDFYGLQPSVDSTTEMVASSPTASKGRLLKHRRNKNAGNGDQFLVASHFQPQPASLDADHPERPKLAGDEQEQEEEAASSLPISSVFSTALNAPAFPVTTLLPSIATDGLVGTHLNQASHLQSLPPGISEIFLSPEAQVQPTLESLSGTPGIKAGGDFFADATSTSRGFNSHTAEEQVPIASDSTEEGRREDSVADLPPWDSNSTPSDWRAHHQRVMRSDDVFMDGFAVVSDDACGSGNYTAEMSLRSVAMGKTPSLPNNFLAQIVLQGNKSRPTLSIKSCCVTPTVRPADPEAACCLFPRSSRECIHIQMLQNSKSQTANFTIQLFQMVSYPVAFLHCELSVCLSDGVGCEQSCLSTLSKPSSRDSYQTLHNIISFGPVPNTQVEFTSGPVTGSDVTMMLPALLGLLTSIVVLTPLVLLLWLYRKRQIKMAAALEPHRMEAP